jgi:hypothetical protein
MDIRFVNHQGFLLLLVLKINLLFAQNKVKYDSIKDNSIGLSTLKFNQWSDNQEGVYFFCPTGEDYVDSAYIKQSKVYEKNERIPSFTGVITFIFYKESNNNSKNPFLVDRYKTNDSIINQLQCFVLLKSEKNIKRAQKIMGEKFNYKVDKYNSNLYRIDITDFACPKDLPSKTAFYLEILNEILVPKYTLEEKIEILEQKVKDLEIALIKLSNELKVNEKKEKSNCEEVLEETKDKKK